MPYCEVHDGSSGYAYYVSPRPGQFVAVSVREEVSQVIANFLNNLPAGISPGEVLHAFGLGRPHGALKFPRDWERGQIWFTDDSRQSQNQPEVVATYRDTRIRPQLAADIADSRQE